MAFRISVFRSFNRRLLWSVCLMSALLFLLPAYVHGHAVLVKAVPEPNSQMKESPPRIELTFNERLEDRLYTVKLIDEIGRSAVSAKPYLNADHTMLLLDLPTLANGNYIVTYHVISTDGHPVDGSYVLTVGFQAPSVPAGSIQHQHEISVSTLQPVEYFQFAARIAYYVTLLSLTGWVLWTRLLGPAAREQQERLRGWTLAWQRAFLLSLIFLIYTHFRELLGDQGMSGLLPLFTGTRIGLSWTFSLILAGLGFALLHRYRLFDIVWVLLLLAAKTLNGHAIALQPAAALLPLNGLHLLAASFWVGGLWLIVVFRKERAFLADAMPRFSRAAFWSLVVLTVSGVVSTLLFLPSLSYVLYSQWGTLLLIKVGLVLLVVLTGAVIRYFMRRRGVERTGKLVAVDFSLMLLIVAIVGILTYLAPVRPNEPLSWHVMGETRHITVKISPNAPGINNFVVKVWMAEQLGQPKYVQLRLTPIDKKDVAPIEVPIQPFVDPEVDYSYGFARYSYRSEGPYMPFPGRWNVEVRVMDANDDETVYKYDMRLY